MTPTSIPIETITEIICTCPDTSPYLQEITQGLSAILNWLNTGGFLSLGFLAGLLLVLIVSGGMRNAT